MTLSFDPDTLALDARHFIGGAAVAGAPGMALYRPSDGAGLADAPVAGAEVVDRAVETAQRALRSSGWGSVPPRDRTRAMHAGPTSSRPTRRPSPGSRRSARPAPSASSRPATSR